MEAPREPPEKRPREKSVPRPPSVIRILCAQPIYEIGQQKASIYRRHTLCRMAGESKLYAMAVEFQLHESAHVVGVSTDHSYRQFIDISAYCAGTC